MGKPVQTIKKGDVVWIAPNVKHWHGAGEFTAMAHIALSPAQDNAVTWLEKVDLPKTAKPVAQISGSLKPAQLTLIPLAYAVATGNSAQLDTAIDQGLAAGLTVSELTEAISHQFAYIGAPKTLNGVAALQKTLGSQKSPRHQRPARQECHRLGQRRLLRPRHANPRRVVASPDQPPDFRLRPCARLRHQSPIVRLPVFTRQLGRTRTRTRYPRQPRCARQSRQQPTALAPACAEKPRRRR